VTNPFEVPGNPYLVLRNDEGQHSLWPAFADVPAGWEVACGPTGRDECMAYVRENWTDIRPRSVAAFVAEHSGR
jgi:MbtH protein